MADRIKCITIEPCLDTVRAHRVGGCYRFFAVSDYRSDYRDDFSVFHEFPNMTPETKCIQTIFVAIAEIIIIVIDKEMFFETKHVGNLLEEEIKKG